MTVADTIRQKIADALDPEELVVEDQSAQHAGHAGARPGGETHFRLVIVAESFAGLSRIDRQRRVHEILAAELAGPVHALSIVARTPAEAGDR